MKNPYSPQERSQFYSGLVLAFLPAIYGIYLILGVWLVDRPYLLSDTNPQLVRYDTIIRVTKQGQTMSRQAIGKRLSDGKKYTAYLLDICERYPERPCKEWESIINQQGLEVNTYFFKSDKIAFILAEDTRAEVNRACIGYTISYSFFSIFFWLLFFSHHLRRLYYRYWYLPRYGDEDED